MENLKSEIITSNNLELVSISQKYVKDIFKEFTANITTYMTPEAPNKIEETEEFIASSINKMNFGKELQMVVLRKKSHEFLGCAGLHKVNTKTPKLGVWIKQSAHGHGYGKEAIIALKNWADKYLDYKYLSYPVDKRNISSTKIPESLGGIIETDEYTTTTPKGRILTEVEYRIYKEVPDKVH